jgi:hypothetical protein
MPVCPRCRSEFERGSEWCAACDVLLLDVIRPENSASPLPDGVEGSARGNITAPNRRNPGSPDRNSTMSPEAPAAEERLLLLLEEPLPEMAEMIREFLQNCGIGCVVQSESIGLLYRLPAPGAPISRARVFVLESDYPEARELVAHFFNRS